MHEYNPLCQSLTHVTTFKDIPLQPRRSPLAEMKVRMDKSGLPWNSLAAVMGVVLSRLMQYDLYHLCCCMLSFLSNTWLSVEGLNKLQRKSELGKVFPSFREGKGDFYFLKKFIYGKIWRRKGGEQKHLQFGKKNTLDMTYFVMIRNAFCYLSVALTF